MDTCGTASTSRFSAPARIGRQADRLRVLPTTSAVLGALSRRTALAAMAALTVGLVGSKATIAAETPARVGTSKPATASPARARDAKDATVPAQTETAPAATGRRLLREGFALTDQLGTFRMIGGRLVFATDKEGIRLVALENLNLERIARVVANNPSVTTWRITATATECRGVNYILIERAVLRGEGDPARP
jgi:hypothetical protein